MTVITISYVTKNGVQLKTEYFLKQNRDEATLSLSKWGVNSTCDLKVNNYGRS